MYVHVSVLKSHHMCEHKNVPYKLIGTHKGFSVINPLTYNPLY